MPMFILLIVIIPHQQMIHSVVLGRVKKRRGVRRLTNELLTKYIGKFCAISTGSIGSTTKGKIVDIKDNWIEVETPKGPALINAEFVLNIKIK